MSDINLNNSSEVMELDKSKEIIELTNKLLQKDKDNEQLTRLLSKTERLLQRANNYNEDLRKELSALNSKLHDYRNCNNKDVSTQVSEAAIEEAYGNKPMPEWGGNTIKNSSTMSIAETLKAAAEAELQNLLNPESENQSKSNEEAQKQIQEDTTSEYIYDAATGFYYHPATGYYWDPSSELFYEYTTGTYYQYDQQTGEYKVHSVVEATGKPHTLSGNSTGQAQKKYPSRHSTNMKGSKKSSVTKMLTRRKKSSSRSKKSKNNCDGVDKGHLSKIKQKSSFSLKSIVVDNKLSTEHNVDLKCEEEDATVMQLGDESNECISESSDSLATDESELVSDLESGELTGDSSGSDVEMIDTETTHLLDSSHHGTEYFDNSIPSLAEIAENHPPCIRVIVQESEHLSLGALYLITCAGGSIGREKNMGHAIEIHDSNISKLHAELIYDYENSCYTITDKGSQNGTILNGNRMSQSKSPSLNHKLSHGDILELGTTKLLLHIHKGHDTCEDCEPGQVQAKLKAMNPIKNDYVVLSKEERNKQRRKELKTIKKKYGLQNSSYENTGAVLSNADYCDKAHLRRKFIGSEANIHREDERPASVQSPITAENKGHKLLAKMGWKEGEGLGKANSGIAEPINVEMRLNRSAGLGSASDVSLSLDKVHNVNKAKRWTQAKERYKRLEQQPVAVAEDRLTPSSKQVLQNSIKPSKCVTNADSDMQDQPIIADSPARMGLLQGSRDPYESCYDSTPAHSRSSTNRPKMSWVSGGTEQVGLVLEPNTLQQIPGEALIDQDS
ncbi:unnamed protein product [Lymnaea stagnalis]|uniref:Angiogenic factor with G patch and FHA domains 1 n=1 Tax=Lymnaea stagnalis TaxID=6523 RepID=A0AAV2HK21_LYMST